MDLILEETVGEQSKKAIVAIGRWAVPTEGHYKVIGEMKKYIRENPDMHLESRPVVVIVDGEKTGQDKTRNPLSVEDRIKFMQASGKANNVQFLTANSGFAAFEEVRKNGMEPIVVAAGSDRAENYVKLLDKYFTTKAGEPIKHYTVQGLDREISATDGTEMEKALKKLKQEGELDDSEVSGSMARRAVELDYLPEFAAIVGLQEKPKLAKLMFDKIKKAMLTDKPAEEST